MALLRLNTPLASPEPTIKVENKLRAGEHKFRLVVEDEEGNQSEPDDCVVIVVARP